MNPFDKTIPIAVTIGMLGITRKVDPDQITVDADKSMLNTVKKILDCDEYRAISTASGKLKAYLHSKAVPGGKSLFKAGTFPIPIASVEEVDKELPMLIGEFNQAVEKFVLVYPTRIKEALGRLKSIGDFSDYVSPEKVRSRFYIRYEWTSLGPPTGMETISKEIYDRELAKIQESYTVAAEEVQLVMRTMAKEFLEHTIEKFKPGPNGERKKIKNVMSKDMQEFWDEFPKRNITNDTELQSWINRIRKLLSGVDPATLRTNKNIKSMTQQALEGMKKSIDKMIENSPARRIVLED